MKKKALFLDRDGTLNHDTHYLRDPDEVALIPGAREALLRARELGYVFYMVTNQSGVNRGMLTMDDVHACNRRLFELLNMGDDLFAGICIAPERPDEPSEYRKPSPKYILEMIARDGLNPDACYMLGDRESDWLCGVNAGIQPVALKTGKAINEKASTVLAAHGIPLYDSIVEFVATLD
ncbi:D-glycero-alpha-D-manno-heptose-1,7-bisphosphate 7-phosphatase [Cerasicoccus fimbriatus]|uniref:D-glycero-alpha-D-manno-heptose-1,7-bisphosphate 7-phosphatase n=1 Tax=Cerasicoccus fimbriatus TaxID=3014554 RepID=UPI0022B559B7|nr:HAD-IIIA family hydrolase [Cerasicoccus sp. TK19100]